MRRRLHDEIRRVVDTTDLVEVASRFTTLNRSLNGPCPVCGGTDRFYIHRGKKAWGCRGCTDRADDVVGLVSKVMRVSPKEAVEYLGGKLDKLPPPRPVPVQPKKNAPGVWTEDKWQLSAMRTIRFAREQFAANLAGLRYMESRGFTKETCLKFGVGYDEYRNCMVIPWILPDKRVCSIKYRRLGDVPKGKRFFSSEGGDPIVFGSHLITGSPAVVIIEGEFNAMAVHQAVGGAIDVYSVGSESCIPHLEPILESYPMALVWADKLSKAQNLRVPPQCQATRIESPQGLDANDILRDADLLEFLSLVWPGAPLPKGKP